MSVIFRFYYQGTSEAVTSLHSHMRMIVVCTIRIRNKTALIINDRLQQLLLPKSTAPINMYDSLTGRNKYEKDCYGLCIIQTWQTWYQSEDSACAEQSEPQSENVADIDWNCLLSKLLYLPMPISISQMNPFRTTIIFIQVKDI